MLVVLPVIHSIKKCFHQPFIFCTDSSENIQQSPTSHCSSGAQIIYHFKFLEDNATQRDLNIYSKFNIYRRRACKLQFRWLAVNNIALSDAVPHGDTVSSCLLTEPIWKILEHYVLRWFRSIVLAIRYRYWCRRYAFYSLQCAIPCNSFIILCNCNCNLLFLFFAILLLFFLF